MPNKFGQLKLLKIDSKEEEFIKAFDDYVTTYDLAYDKAKLIYQIKELREQNKINRRLVYATWFMAIASWILIAVTFYSKK